MDLLLSYGKLWDLKNPLYKLIYTYFKRQEKNFIREANAIISLTNEGKSEMRSWGYTAIDSKTTVIPCCVDLDLFQSSKTDAQQKSQLLEQLGIEQHTAILGYVGSIGTWYMLNEMLAFYKVYRAHHAKSVFLFISGEERKKLVEQAALLNIPEDEIVVKSVTHDQVPSHLELFDASVFFILPSYSKKASSPTKQGELMAMGIPIICNSGVGDTAEIIEKYHAGSVVHEFTNDSYEKAITELNAFDRNRSIEGAQSYFALSEGVARYAAIYTELIG